MVYSSFSPCHLNKLLSKFTSVTYSNLPWYIQCLSFLYFTSLSCIEVFSQDLDLPRSLPFSFRNFFHVIGAGICLGDDPLLLPGRTRPVYISRFCNSYLLPLKYSLRWWERDDDLIEGPCVKAVRSRVDPSSIHVSTMSRTFYPASNNPHTNMQVNSLRFW